MLLVPPVVIAVACFHREDVLADFYGKIEITDF